MTDAAHLIKGTQPIDREPSPPRPDEDAKVLVVDRPPHPGTIEIKGPPGLSVSLTTDVGFTRVVLHLPQDPEDAWRL